MTKNEVDKLILQKELNDENIPLEWKMDNSESGPKGEIAAKEKSADAAFALVQIGKKDNQNTQKEIIPY